MQSLPLRMGGGGGAILGRFVDEIPLLDQPLLLYSNAEDIEEDPELPSDSKEKEGIEHFKRKRKSRYRRRTELILEGSGSKVAKNASKLKYIGNAVDTKTDNSSSRYVLLQVVKQTSSDGLKPDVHVNVVPVDDWYDFRKPVPTKILTLDDVTAEIERAERRRKETNARYSLISKKMEARHTATGEEDNEDNPYKLPKGGRGGKFRGHMNATGVDVDAENEFKGYCGFEYERVASDDEEDFGEEQAELNEREDRVMPLGGVEDDDMGFDDEEDSSLDEDEDEEEEEQESSLTESRMAGAAVLAASRQMKQHIEMEVMSDSDAASDTSKGSKRKAPSPTKDVSAGVSSSTDQPPAKRRSHSPPPPITADPTQSLSVSSVHAYISRVGGRITIKELGLAFKRAIKTMGERGKQRFKEIVLEITNTEDDPLRGKCLVLKQ